MLSQVVVLRNSIVMSTWMNHLLPCITVSENVKEMGIMPHGQQWLERANTLRPISPNRLCKKTHFLHEQVLKTKNGFLIEATAGGRNFLCGSYGA